MRILLDPIYSSRAPKCSSAFKFKMLAERILSSVEDAQVYWRIPDWTSEEDLEWFPKHERLHLLRSNHAKSNRVLEYTLVRNDLFQQTYAFGEFYDLDLVFTMRTGMVPSIKMAMSQRRIDEKSKRIVILEEMAIINSRKHISGAGGQIQDDLTILGYDTADVTLITAGHVRNDILVTARSVMPSSRCLGLSKKIKLVRPVDLMEFHTKPKFHGGPMEMLYTGRLNASTSNTKPSFKAFETAFVMAGDDTPDLTISTVTENLKVDIPEFADLQRNSRDDFHELLRDKADIAVYMTVDAEFSLTLIEPLCFGVPVLVTRRPWSEALIGKNYPFFVKGATDAYAYLKAWQESYDELYAQFLEWRDGEFRERFSEGGAYGDSLYDEAMAVVHSMTEYKDGVKVPPMVEDLAKEIVPGEPFTMFQLMKSLHKKGLMDADLSEKAWKNDAVPAALKPNVHGMRIALKKVTGAIDCAEPGVMKVPA